MNRNGVGGLESTVTGRILGRFLKFAFVFEPFTPPVVSYYLRRRLGTWKSQGLISDYTARTKRLGVFHYRIQVEMGLSSRQATYILEHSLPKEIESVRRWLNV